MKILIVHNHYGRFAQGGEANVMNAEARLLTEHGHEVMKYERTNAEIYEDGSLVDKVRAFCDVGWSEKSYQEIRKVIQDFDPDIMHVHNYWLALTPSIFAAAKECGVKTVLTLHNYRLICPGNQFMRNNEPCTLCLDGKGWRCMVYRCFPDRSMLKCLLSTILYYKTSARSFLSPWVDAYISLTAFGHSRFIAAGLPAKKVFVKPNFMPDPLGCPTFSGDEGNGGFYAGRVSAEKGIETVIDAWAGLEYPLRVAGDGPLLGEMKRKATCSVRWLGWQSRDETLIFLKKSTFFIFPSILYEGFPLSLLEAMALGKPIIASDLGPRREMIEDGVSGLLFEAGNPKDLRAKIETLISDPSLRMRLGQAARDTYLSRYTPEKNYEMLINVYEHALQS